MSRVQTASKGSGKIGDKVKPLSKNKVIIVEIAAIIALSISLYILGKNPKAPLAIGFLTVFLTWIMLDPPSRHRQMTEDEIRDFKGPLAKPSIIPQFTMEEEEGWFSIRRYQGDFVECEKEETESDGSAEIPEDQDGPADNG